MRMSKENLALLTRMMGPLKRDINLPLDGYCHVTAEGLDKLLDEARREGADPGDIIRLADVAGTLDIDQIRSIPVAPSSSDINAWIDEQVKAESNRDALFCEAGTVVPVEDAAEIARAAALSIIADKETLIANLRRAGYTVTGPGEAV